MSCCGKHRAAGGGPPPRIPTTTNGHSTRPPARQTSVFFEYVGRTGLTVVGPVSGRRYRFDAPGSRQPIDPADKPSLAAVQLLRQVSGP
jgi:hypothetical protein